MALNLITTKDGAELIAPTVHINGTSKAALVNGYVIAAQAIEDAIMALRANAPNTRDYYPQGHGAIERAQLEHRARLSRLHDMVADLRGLAEAIDA